MEIYQSPSVVRRSFSDWYNMDPRSRLTIQRIHTNSVVDNIKGVSGHKVTVRTEKNIRKIENYVRLHRNASMRRIGLFVGMTNFTARKILTEDLSFKPYSSQGVQALKATDKDKRLSTSRVLFAISVVKT